MQREAQLQDRGQGRWALAGDLLFGNSARVLAQGDAAFGREPHAEIDLSQVGRVDSAGLALLLEWTISARTGGRAVVYRNPPPLLAALARISDVEEFLESNPA